jgi:succinate-semialdehyde dehydrogenase/glutarate-semialdehyde dehydrogenase
MASLAETKTTPGLTPAAAGLLRHASLVGGREVQGRGGVRSALDPSTGAAFAEVTLLDAAQAAEAVTAAGQAFPAWAACGFAERGRRLLSLRQAVVEEADAIAALIAREQGKPAAEAHLVEIFPALAALKHLAHGAEDVLRDEPVPSEVPLFVHKDARLVRVPVGVVLVITPWNYPFSIALSGLATAVAAGNTVVLKPAPATTLIGLRLGELCRKAGIPDGVVNVVATDDTVGAGLVEDPRLGKIVFTGSVATGKKVMAAAARNLTPVVLELGGKDAAIVCRDADVERAARGIVWGAFVNAGQTCASVERVYVEQPVAEAFIARVVEETRGLRVGDPAAPSTDVGPMTMERQRRVVEEHVQDAVARGATVLAGGARPPGPGWFYPPTVLTGVDHTMRIMREETFGPVLPIMVVASVDEALALANDSDYGLTASGWTRDPETARRLQEGLQAGVVTINDCLYSFGEPTAPWGGFKRSGIGRIHGLAGLLEMTQVKYVSRDTGRGPMLWWYPYGPELARVASATGPAMHAASLWSRLRHQARLLASRRFRGRVSLRALIQHADRLF